MTSRRAARWQRAARRSPNWSSTSLRRRARPAPDGVGTSGTSSSSRRAVRVVVAQPLWAVDCLGNIGNDTVAPAANFVAEEPEATCPGATDGTNSDYTRLAPLPSRTGACSITNRPPARAPRAPSGRGRRPAAARACCDGLEDPAVQPNRMPAGTKGQPVQVDATLRVCHGAVPPPPSLMARRARVVRNEPRAFCGELRSQIGARPDGRRRTAPDHELDSFKPEKEAPMERILIAIDGSPASHEAVEFGVELAAEQDAAVIFVHVVPASGRHPDDLLRHGCRSSAARGHARKRGSPSSRRRQPRSTRAYSATAKLLIGDAVDEIVACADNLDVDLIVIGSRGHGKLTSALLGSVSRGVVSESKRPVLIIRGLEAAQPEASALSLTRR